MAQFYIPNNGGGGGGSDKTTSMSPYVPAIGTLNMDDTSVLNAGVLTIPTSTTLYGAYNMVGTAGPYTVTQIVGVPAYEIELRDTGTIQTQFDFTPESSATTNDLVSEIPGSVTLYGEGDYIKIRKIPGEVFNRTTDASTYD